MKLEKHELLAAVIELVQEAGEAVMRIYESDDFDVKLKSDHSPLTKADLAANEIITKGLRKLAPNIPVVSEEALLSDEERLASSSFWLVDPIDGTKEFIKKNGQFTLNVGLIEDGEPVLGVVYAPARDVLYYGGRGLGAWKERDGHKEKIQVADGSRPLIAVGSLSHPSPAAAAWLQDQGVAEIVSVGSSLKLCYVSEGAADVYPRIDAHLSDWDIAAADAVLRAAGGLCEVFETGETLRYDRPTLKLPHFLVRSKHVLITR
ncbi:3'(2'),5'-bisphosphate nucleotidase CysQ [Candidatus Saccharibacteria bacterium]|nr:3'(2'),5'-bisphosphate nucleotidase CysQ [Candidatus Saccharibacteria bacterium]